MISMVESSVASCAGCGPQIEALLSHSRLPVIVCFGWIEQTTSPQTIQQSDKQT
jgi:hypothetical protein